MRNIIVIPTYRTGVNLLSNLLKSFNGYKKYPILVVISDYKPSDRELFSHVREKFSALPIIWETIETNSFELGGLYTAYNKTDAEEFFLLSHSCEIIDVALFDIVFEKYCGRSVPFGLQTGNWKNAFGERKQHEKFIRKYLSDDMSVKLLSLGDVIFWQGHIGKYRRCILDKMNIPYYLPTNMVEAISQSELLFTSTYHSLDTSTVVLFPDWRDGNNIENKFGKRRLKISNQYIIKWKTHWTSEMIIDDMKSQFFGYRIVKAAKLPFLLLKEKCITMLNLIRERHPLVYARMKRIKQFWAELA